MRPNERRDTGQQDLLRSRLDQIVDAQHPLVTLASSVDWQFLEQRFGASYTDRPGRPPLPTRLMAGLAILKHTYDLSDEVLCERWLENPYYQLFCGEEFFRHTLPFDRSSMTRWRQRMGEEKLTALLQESLSLATRSGAAKPVDFTRVIVDTTVQPKAIAFPTDARLLHRARERLVRLAQTHGMKLRQSYRRVGKLALIQHQRYAHAKQFKRANRALRTLRTQLGRVIRDIGRKIGEDAQLREIFALPLSLARRVRGSAGRKSTACTHLRWNASARGRHTSPTSSASRSRWQHRCTAARAGSSSPMSRPCQAIRMTATHWQRSSPPSSNRSACR